MNDELHSVHVESYLNRSPNPRPAKRHKASKAEWSFLRRQKIGDGCRVCHTSFRTELHHLVPRSNGGDDFPSNLVELCSLHHAMVEARDTTVSMMLGLSLLPDERAYVTQKKGAYYLHDRYRVAIQEDDAA